MADSSSLTSTLFGSIICDSSSTAEPQWIGTEVVLVVLSFSAGLTWFHAVNPMLMRMRRRQATVLKDRSSDSDSDSDSGASSSSSGETPDASSTSVIAGAHALAARLLRGKATKQEKTDPPPLSLVGLPRELIAEAAMFLDLKDVAAVGTANNIAQRKFWQAPEVWSMLAVHRGLGPLPAIDSGPAAREAFRRGAYRVDGCRLNLIGAAIPGSPSGSCAHAAVLAEAAHVVRGIMPSDGTAAAEGLCHAAEKSLQAHDPAKEEAANAADAFLRLAHRRGDVLSAQQMERLEGAYGSALQLQALMDAAMHDQLEQFEYEPSTQVPSGALASPAGYSLEPGGNDSLNFSYSPMLAALRTPELPDILPDLTSARYRSVSPSGVRSMDAALEDVHEAQRHSELDVLLEELRRQNGE